MKTDLRKIVLIGAGGHGRVVADIAAQNGYGKIVFLDSAFPAIRKNLMWDVVGKSLEDVDGSWLAFVAVGNCTIRLGILEGLRAAEREVPSLIHPSAAISSYSNIGFGSAVMPQTVINAGAVVGFGAIVNSGATIDHDCQIGNGVHISPGVHLAGGVKIGDGSWIGIGSVIRENIEVGKGVTVGAGSVVVKDIGDGQTVVGVPAQQRLREI